MSKSKEKEKKSNEVAVAVISSLIISVIGVGLNSYVTIQINKTNIENVTDRLDRIDDNMNNLAGKVEENGKMISAHDAILDMYKQLSQNTQGASAKKVCFNDNSFLKMAFANENNFLASPIFNSKGNVATDLETNQDYDASDLQNTLIITYYTEGENEVYFLGQYNENNYWHGECILNVYKNSELFSVFEGVYNNGSLCSYKRIACDESGKWTYADRTNCQNYTLGETWDYEKEKSFPKEINPENMDDKKIWKIDSFHANINEKLVGYYNGRTSNTKYNDNSGTAYIARYNNEGNLRYLYRGVVKDGNGESENGWAVIWLENKNTYRIYEGEFIGGSPTNYDNYKEITEETKMEIVGYDFNCPLTGLIE